MLIGAAGFISACAPAPRFPAPAGDQTMPRMALRDVVPQPRTYLASRRTLPVTVDGRLDDAAWQRAPWTSDFTDIEGPIRPRPPLRTRVKMLWDEQYWYIGAELEEPDLWATITERDAVIFHDNDFELFVNPTGDTHRYFEVEINALATVWDLFLPKPYRDGGSAVNAWNIVGLRAAVALQGTLNHPGDRDRGWTVELAIPWAAFADSAHIAVPPREGQAWRVNFSRVEWDRDVAAGAYRVRTDSTGKPLPEHNWVWSPQGAVNMHMPEMWGTVQFGGTAIVPDTANDDARWVLRRVYYGERDYQRIHGAYTADRTALGVAALPADLQLSVTTGGWEAALPRSSLRPAWHIRTDGLIWHD